MSDTPKIEVWRIGVDRYAFTINGTFVDGQFHPMWGITTYGSKEKAKEAAEEYLRKVAV